MTFSIRQRDVEDKQILGTLWAGDESLARVLAALFFPSIAQTSLIIQRTDDREIPFRLNVEAHQF